MEVGSFVWECSNEETWMQVALTPACVTERVFLWRWHLKVCSELLCNSNKLGAAWLTIAQHGSLGEVEQLTIKELALDDGCDLRRLLESMLDQLNESKAKRNLNWTNQAYGNVKNQKNQALIQNVKLVGILLERLKAPRAMSIMGSPQSSLYIDARMQLLKVDSKTVLRKEQVGRGSTGIVYEGEWFGAIKVALKNAERSKRCYHKMEKICLLSHPNNVSVLGYIDDEDGDKSFSEILELMDGDLSTLMEQRMQVDSNRGGPFSIWEACDIMLQIAEGVRYMHQNNVLCRDVKPSNILFKRSEGDTLEYVHAKVADFGVIERFDKGITNISMSSDYWACRWVAPELLLSISGLKNSNKYLFKSDVYSFGMTCFEILTGEMPFANEDISEVRTQVFEGARPTLSEKTPQSLRNLIKLCWDPSPILRPSFADICKELRYIRCSLLLEPQDHTPQLPLPVPDLLHLPPHVSKFKGEYSSLKVVRKLASGGSDMVTVYLSTWLQSKNEVAQKRFMGSHNECFTNEVSIMAELEHPNVVHLLHYASDRRSCSIVMELMDGDLHNLMDGSRFGRKETSTGPFSMADAVHVILQIARGMEYVHGKYIVHRDLKSCNILIKKASGGRKLEVKVADFGTSMKLESRDSLLGKEESGVGTTRWMAPEVARMPASEASSKYDPFMSDVFSFGMLCYEILVGRVPFYEVENLHTVRKNVLDGRRPTLPEWTPSNLKDLIEKCWVKDASKRPTFTDIVANLTYDRVETTEGLKNLPVLLLPTDAKAER